MNPNQRERSQKPSRPIPHLLRARKHNNSRAGETPLLSQSELDPPSRLDRIFYFIGRSLYWLFSTTKYLFVATKKHSLNVYKRLPAKYRDYIVAGVAIAVIVPPFSIIRHTFMDATISEQTSSNAGASGEVKDLPQESPDFSTLTPKGKDTSDLKNGWTRVSPPGAAAVYAYADAIEGISISVSQQKLPDSFRSSSAEKVKELATDFSATTEFKAGNTIVYSGISVDGPQSIIFIKEDLLVLIKAEREIKQDDLTKYIESLD